MEEVREIKQAALSMTALPAEIKKPFQMIIFDWDGTAVEDRYSDASAMADRLRRLIDEGVICIIITGTNVDNVSRQLSWRRSDHRNENLYACTNRGSEVYRWNDAGVPVLLYRRTATPEEDRALDCAVAELRSRLESRGLRTEVIANRLNRRKLDLIPVDEWRDPKKSQFAGLLQAVTERLRKAGMTLGLKRVLREATDCAIQCGLPQAKITSDIKHIEIGLTNKGDSIRWIKDNLLDARGIRVSQVIIFGDELGPVGGIPGSDSFMRIPGLEGTPFVSVGVEPNGIPPGVIHLRGGPMKFLEFLEFRSAFPHATEMRDWLLEQEGFDPSREREMETLFSIGNGYCGIRGSVNLLIPTSLSDLFIAGVYDRKSPGIPYSEQEFLHGVQLDTPEAELVPFPFPLRFTVQVGGKELSLSGPALTFYRRVLQLRDGCLREVFRFKDDEGRETEIRTLRWASLADRHLLLHEITIRRLNHSSPIRIDTSMDDPDFPLLHPHLELLRKLSDAPLSEARVFETKVSKVQACFASRTWIDGADSSSRTTYVLNGDKPEATLRRVIGVGSSREFQDPLRAVTDILARLDPAHFDSLLRANRESWDEFWQGADIRFIGNPSLTQAQRFNLYHLRIGLDHDPRTSLSARALTGRAYEGHIFWDTEIFVLPSFLYSRPDIARCMLAYRFRTLPGAKKRAQESGLAGAWYAWESTQTGADVTPQSIVLDGAGKKIVPILTGKEQIHISADVAFAVWRYWESTGDSGFMRDQGCEILFETASFWASRVSEDRGRFHIRNVIGPDEYHVNVDDNAYTNWMARFNLEIAVSAADWLKANDPGRWSELSLRLGISARTLGVWSEISRLIYFPEPNAEGVIEQFRGFFDLDDATVDHERMLKSPFSRLLKWEDTTRSKVLKQADVLMIPFLFPDAFPIQVTAANYRYYEPRTEHGSSLSPPVHAAIAARIGLEEDSYRLWNASLHLDLLNLMGNTSLGFHCGCSGGAWQALVFHFLDIRFDGNEPRVDPSRLERLGIPCESVELNIAYRDRAYRVQFRKKGGIAA